MAETLTVDTTPQTETLGDNLTPDEQDSLKVGEEMINQQEQLLAGKYKNAEELEKAYAELEKKLGEQSNKDNEPTSESEVPETEEVSEEKEEAKELSPAAELITTASEEFYNNDGKLAPETINKFTSMSSKELVEAYMQVQSNLPQGGLDDGDLSDAAVNEVKNFAGGEEAYSNLVTWASQNLDSKSVEAFDNVINTGNVETIKLVVNGLKSQYENANGYEGRMLTGKAPKVTSQDVFRSQAELVAAMGDRRYDRDPAYRQDVIEKLERSGNLQF